MRNRPIAFDAIIYQPEQQRFNGSDRGHLAGRCLLDSLEFLRINPKWSARFAQVINAHAIRLCWRCLDDLQHDVFKARVRSKIDEAYDSILEGSQTGIVVFGDDFWDWAYILEALLTVPRNSNYKRKAAAIKSHLQTFFDKVEERLEGGLSIESPAEWFGPGIPTAAYRLLHRYGDVIENGTAVKECLDRLKEKALAPVRIRDNEGKYLGHVVRPNLPWHIGQVVEQFPEDSKKHEKYLCNLNSIETDFPEKSERTYVLARIYQGAAALKKRDTCRRVIEMLCECEDLGRPLGAGVMGDQVKGSLNVLEALWPTLSKSDRKEVGLMLNSLLFAQSRSNRIGIVVAIEREREACIRAFSSDGATVTDEGDYCDISYRDYQGVIVRGKALIEAAHVTSTLISEHHVTRIIMVGIAGSLGTRNEEDRFVGPKIGDVVIATSTAGYRVREKVREQLLMSPCHGMRRRGKFFQSTRRCLNTPIESIRQTDGDTAYTKD